MSGGGDLARALADALREAFEGGEIAVGTKLANEIVLSEQLQISRPTLREAVRVLIHEGWLESRRGIGTFVAPRPVRPLRGHLDTMNSMSAAIAATGAKPGVRGFGLREVAAATEVAQMLEIARGSMVARIVRTRLADGRPVASATEYVRPSERVPLSSIRAFDGTSLYRFMQDELRTPFAYSRLSLRAVAARRDVASMLAMREVVFDKAGQPLLYTINHHNTAIAEFSLLRYGQSA
jgi:DNA-binding GntR family transcriptional regulator